jgi:hypothetical protein
MKNKKVCVKLAHCNIKWRHAKQPPFLTSLVQCLTFHTRSGFQRLGRAHDPHLCLDHHLRDDGAVVGQEGLQLGFTKCYAGLSYDDDSPAEFTESCHLCRYY